MDLAFSLLLQHEAQKIKGKLVMPGVQLHQLTLLYYSECYKPAQGIQAFFKSGRLKIALFLACFAGRLPALPSACTIAMPRRIVQFMPLLNRQRDPLIFESSSSSASTPLITRDKHSPLKHKITWKDSALEAEQARLQLQSIDGRITFARARPSDAQSNSTDLIRSLSESN